MECHVQGLVHATHQSDRPVRSQYLMAMQTCVACRDWPLVLELFETLPQANDGRVGGL